jgi:hypothetical protein
MAVVTFTIVMYVLAALFLILYSLPAARNFFLSINSGALSGLYNNLDQFFCFIWERSLGTFVKTSFPSEKRGILYGLILVLLAVTILVIIIDCIIGFTSKKRKADKIKYSQAVKEELDKLNDVESSSSFTNVPKNFDMYANSREPHVSLAEDMEEGSEQKIALLQVKKKPYVRISLSIVYTLLCLFLLLMRFTYQTGETSLYNVFQGFLSLSLVSSVNQNFTAFFSTLLSGIYASRLTSSFAFTWGQLVELLLLFVGAGLFWLLVLLICHYVIKAIRRREAKHRVFVSEEEAEKKEKHNKKMGNADLDETSSNVSFIADLSPFPSSSDRNKQKEEKAMYIDDISKYVREAGTIKGVDVPIPLSPVRKPLTPENVQEDISENKSVTIKDIASIEDSFKKEEETVAVESFSVPDDQTPTLDLSTVDISLIAYTSKEASDKKYSSQTDDMIAFDQDGYAYLVKSGKPFSDEQEDISDVITADNLDKTAIISRFGEKYYSILNSLEPFKLHPLDYDEEIKKIHDRAKADELLNAEAMLKSSLSSQPFKESDFSLAQEKVKEEEETIKEEKETSPIIPILAAQKLEEEKPLPPFTVKRVATVPFKEPLKKENEAKPIIPHKIETKIAPQATNKKEDAPIKHPSFKKPVPHPVAPKIVSIEEFKGAKKQNG